MTELCELEFDGLENAGLEIDRPSQDISRDINVVAAELNAAQTIGFNSLCHNADGAGKVQCMLFATGVHRIFSCLPFSHSTGIQGRALYTGEILCEMSFVV